MAHSSRFWAVVGFAIGVFWLMAFFLLFSVHGPIVALIFYGAMCLTCPVSLALLLLRVDVFLVLFIAPFLNALAYGLMAHWWISRKIPKAPRGPTLLKL